MDIGYAEIIEDGDSLICWCQLGNTKVWTRLLVKKRGKEEAYVANPRNSYRRLVIQIICEFGGRYWIDQPPKLNGAFVSVWIEVGDWEGMAHGVLESVD